MSNLRNDKKNNLVSFLRHNRPHPPDAHPDLERRLLEALEPRSQQRKLRFKAAWTVPGAIATGFLFTSISFAFKTPRLALEPKDMENFVVGNWHNTFEDNSYTAAEDTEAYWLLPTVSEQPALSVSAP